MIINDAKNGSWERDLIVDENSRSLCVEFLIGCFLLFFWKVPQRLATDQIYPIATTFLVSSAGVGVMQKTLLEIHIIVRYEPLLKKAARGGGSWG